VICHRISFECFISVGEYFSAERVPQDAVTAQVKQPLAAAAFVKATFLLQDEKRGGGSASVQGVSHVRAFHFLYFGSAPAV
jgi:DICT domain-containing protein